MTASDDRPEVTIRGVEERDVGQIRELFRTVYGSDYPHRDFYEEWWLKRAVYADDLLLLVAEDPEDGRIFGTATVLFDAGAQSDLIAEFGRLAVHPDARGRNIGNRLMQARLRAVHGRIHVGVVENRTVHSFSQRISNKHGFTAVGFLPLKHVFGSRQSIALHARHFDGALALRRNNPRIVPEVHTIAHCAMKNVGLAFDAIVDEESPAYPSGAGFVTEELDSPRGVPALIRIERGRVHRREVFGPMRLHYGFFKLAAVQATYLIARQVAGDSGPGPIAGALGFIRHEGERAVRVFELIAATDDSVRFLFNRLLDICADSSFDYIEVDVSAHAPRMQRTLVELGFVPAAYVPAMVFHDVERLDVIKFVRLLVPPDIGEVDLLPDARVLADEVMRMLRRQFVLPSIAEAVHRLEVFAGLDYDQVARVASACLLREFTDGAHVFEMGVPADELYIVIRGNVEVRLEPHQDAAVGEVGPGESLGEVALLTGEPHSATATARGDVVVATLSREVLQAMIRRRPDIGVVFYRNLAIGLGRKLQRATGRAN